MTATAIADTAFHIVRHVLESAGDAEHRYFRIKNLTNEEVIEFLRFWANRHADANLDDVRVVIARDAEVDVPEAYRAEADRSITWYRNNNDAGLVYIETKVESDEQGLKNMFTLRDNNFLDGTFDGPNFVVREELVRAAWREVHGSQDSLRDPFVGKVCSVLTGLQQAGTAVPVRRFSELAREACIRYTAADRTLSDEQMDAIVGESLITLGLFPDLDWRTERSEAQVSRRLECNSLYADLTRLDGVDLEPEDGEELVRRTVFRDRDGEPLPDGEQAVWKERCSRYCETRSAALREAIPYQIFEQLFKRDVKGLALGERVEQEIQATDPERLREYRNLNVKAGLNRRDAKAAQTFLDAVPAEDGAPSLKDLLSPRTRKTLERLAFPSPENFDNPLLKIADIASTFLTRGEEFSGPVRLRMVPGRDFNPEDPAVGLLAFLFGAAFEALEDRVDEVGLFLSVDGAFKTRVPPPEALLQEEGTSADELHEVNWAPVPVDFELVDSETNETIDVDGNYQWRPRDLDRVAILWLLLCAEDAPAPDRMIILADDEEIETFLVQASSRQTPLDEFPGETVAGELRGCDLLARLIDCRARFRERMSQEGVSAYALREYVDDWAAILHEGKERYVPMGSSDPRLAVLLQMDTVVESAGQSVLMLPTHPFRLRWLGAYLDESERVAARALDGDLRLNSENPQFYLNWLADLSPHQHPPVTSTPARHTVFARSEAGWSESFAPLNLGEEIGDSGGIDARSMDELSRQLAYYVDAHPHKADGLSVLLLLPHGGSLHARLMESFLRGQRASVPLSLHVVTPRRHWSSMVRSFDRMRIRARGDRARALFPSLNLEFVEWKPDLRADELELPDCDIAIIPDFFRSEVVIQHHTDAPYHRPGHFDVLLDPPVHSYGDEQGGSVSVSMKPLSPDPPLEDWSTLVVRNERNRPVAQQQPENSDFVQLEVSFEAASAMFSDLHARAHWVITLDRHISRLQIEGIQPPPDILTVREGVGANRLFTLVVSSSAGRHHVLSRLERKLRSTVGSESPTHDIARSVYDETRTVVPRLALQAMGLSRVTEEMLGVVVAMRTCAQRFPAPPDSIIIWMSLDEHSDWFGGDAGIRADLCRVSLSRNEHGLSLHVLVIEAKLRQQFDRYGVDQIRRTTRLLREMLTVTEPAATDGRLWREEFLRAIENTSMAARQADPGHVKPGVTPERLPQDIREMIRDGQFTAVEVGGIYAICLYEQDSPTKQEETPDGQLILRIGREDMAMALREETAERSTEPAPQPPTQPDVTHPTPESEESESPETVPEPEPAIAQPTAPASTTTPHPDVQPAEKPASITPGPRLSEAELRHRHEIVIDTLQEYSVSVSAPGPDELPGVVEGPASILFRVRPGAGVSPNRIYDKSDALKLRMQLEAEQNITFSISRGFVNIDVPKSEEERYFVDAQSVWERWDPPTDGSLRVPLGEDRFGGIVELNLSSSNSPHVLIGGTTGSGKSEALNTVLLGLTTHYSPHELRLLLVDPKGTELQHLSESTHLEGEIGWDDQDAKALLGRVVEEMQHRYAVFKTARVRSLIEYNALEGKEEARLPWWVIVLDEYADLTSDPDAKKAIESDLKRVAQKARAAGLHLLVATQKPSADVISTNLRSNLPAQLALRVKSATESRVIVDEAGAEGLNGKGDAFLKCEGKLVRVQCARVVL